MRETDVHGTLPRARSAPVLDLLRHRNFLTCRERGDHACHSVSDEATEVLQSASPKPLESGGGRTMLVESQTPLAHGPAHMAAYKKCCISPKSYFLH